MNILFWIRKKISLSCFKYKRTLFKSNFSDSTSENIKRVETFVKWQKYLPNRRHRYVRTQEERNTQIIPVIRISVCFLLLQYILCLFHRTTTIYTDFCTLKSVRAKRGLCFRKKSSQLYVRNEAAAATTRCWPSVRLVHSNLSSQWDIIWKHDHFCITLGTLLAGRDKAVVISHPKVGLLRDTGFHTRTKGLFLCRRFWFLFYFGFSVRNAHESLYFSYFSSSHVPCVYVCMLCFLLMYINDFFHLFLFEALNWLS